MRDGRRAGGTHHESTVASRYAARLSSACEAIASMSTLVDEAESLSMTLREVVLIARRRNSRARSAVLLLDAASFRKLAGFKLVAERVRAVVACGGRR